MIAISFSVLISISFILFNYLHLYIHLYIHTFIYIYIYIYLCIYSFFSSGRCFQDFLGSMLVTFSKRNFWRIYLTSLINTSFVLIIVLSVIKRLIMIISTISNCYFHIYCFLVPLLFVLLFLYMS